MPVNLIDNPGFENGLVGYDNWGNAVAINTDSHSGSGALQVGNGAGGVGQNLDGKLTVGQTYRLGVYAKIGNANEWSAVTIQVRDSAQVQILAKDLVINSNGYQLYTVDFVMPTGGVAVYLSIWKNAGSSNLIVDDLSLVSIP